MACCGAACLYEMEVIGGMGEGRGMKPRRNEREGLLVSEWVIG